MRAEIRIHRLEKICHFLDIRFHNIQIDQQCGRIDLLPGKTDKNISVG
jgi:hypothetical protein